MIDLATDEMYDFDCFITLVMETFLTCFLSKPIVLDSGSATLMSSYHILKSCQVLQRWPCFQDVVDLLGVLKNEVILTNPKNQADIGGGRDHHPYWRSFFCTKLCTNFLAQNFNI